MVSIYILNMKSGNYRYPYSDSILTIVIPVFNREYIVKKTLTSIENQTYRHIDIILVDNASTDSTLSVLNAWKKEMDSSGKGKDFRITVTQCNKIGAAAARNKGLSIVSTPWVMFFDSDDIMLPEHIETTVADIKNHPEADIIGWDTDVNDINGKKICICPFHTRDTQWRNLFNASFSTLNYCIKTDFIRKIGSWNDNIFFWDDIELGARILADNPIIFKSDYKGTRILVCRSNDSITGTYNTNPARIIPALNSIEHTLGLKKKRWILLKKTIEAALYSKNNSKQGKKLYDNALTECNSIFLKLKLTVAYHYTKAGGRGIAFIYRKLKFF